MDTQKLIEAKMEERKAKGLFVQIEGLDGKPFNYFPATFEQKADFIRRALKNKRAILSV